MKKGGKLESMVAFSRQRSLQALFALAALVYLFVIYQLPLFFLSISMSSPPASLADAEFSIARKEGGSLVGILREPTRPLALNSGEDTAERDAPARPRKVSFRVAVSTALPLRPAPPSSSPADAQQRRRAAVEVSGLIFHEVGVTAGQFSELDKSAGEAWRQGKGLFLDLQAGKLDPPPSLELPSSKKKQNATDEEEEEPCPHSLALTGTQFRERGKVLVLPCGLTLGSHMTVVARPYVAHAEYDPKITAEKEGKGPTMVSQFMMELQGLKIADGEDPPRILHFNPRLKGDWSGKPVIEQNTCFRQQWGSSQRCEGWKSRADEESVDGLVKCEKWIRDDDSRSGESKTTWWLKRLIGRTKAVPIDWPYPFLEDKLFVLTLSAGLEGYHVNVDGRHITSFPYRPGFTLEDATGLALNGDVEVHSVFAASLPTTHPSSSPRKILEMSPEWQAAPVPDEPVDLFIGILSAGNHFAERMAVRKSWMQAIKTQKIVARFFVALHGRKGVNVELKREAEFFGDIVIVPFMDSYDLVVLKTVAIAEYGVRAVSAKYVMKCDDDTFVRVDSILKEVGKVPAGKSLYIGNMNYHHKPLRQGKWAVTYEEWPEEDYPTYANGPGYIVSSDIAQFILSEFENNTLRLFKMEDVSMGMWVEQFHNSSRPVSYVHDLKFCQYGCFDGYLTAHYQSPRQMMCMWDKLKATGRPLCCNGR